MAKEFKKDNYFKIDPESHIVGKDHPLYFPAVRLMWRSLLAIKRPLMMGMPQSVIDDLFDPDEQSPTNDPDLLIAAMDKYGVDIGCLLPESLMDCTGYTSRFCTNTEMAKWVDKYPDRLIYQPNVSPIKFKGVKNTIWELEYWVKERGAKTFKYYPPEDTTVINDKELWPFYEKAQELGIVLNVHTGYGWVAPGRFMNGLPMYIDDIARDFPELIFNAFHMGYPHSSDLNMVAMAHKNVYICLSLVVTWALTAPYKFAHLLGEAMRWVGPDKIIWGSDDPEMHMQMGCAVMGLRDFQMPKELQEKYGYPEITDEDKAKMFGGNLAKLLGIDTTNRRVKV
jgi:predicted TIM-barrel fold metal-dependent hydrolase